MHGFLDAFTRDLIDIEFGPVDAEVRERTAAWVRTRFDGAGDVTALGLRVTGMLLALTVILRTGRPYQRLSHARRAEFANRFAVTRLPLAAEYVRVVRSLAVTYVYEARFPAAPRERPCNQP